MNHHVLIKEAGYSLVESIVAIALLVTVLAPLGSFVAHLATHRMSKQKIEAFSLAQLTMAEALKHQDYKSKTAHTSNGKWLVTEQYNLKEDIVIIEVEVFRLNRDKPYVTLRTARLLPLFDRQKQTGL